MVMAAEMAEQPSRLASLIARREEVLDRLAPLVAPPLAGTVVVARGSSDHAATVGRYLLEMATRRPVASASPSVHNLYRAEIDWSGYVVVGVSQSGRTPEIAGVLERARAGGGRTVAITNDSGSPLAEVADAVVELGAGEERAVPATKTVTAEMVAFAFLAAASAGWPEPAKFDALPDQVAAVLADSSSAEAVRDFVGEAERLVITARGPLTGAAAETALKLQETSSLFATAFSAADLRHGPIALATPGLRVLAFVHPGPAATDVLDLARDLASRGCEVAILGPVEGSLAPWAATCPESLAPVLAVVRGQQVALALARARGRNPDHPEGLSKVTAT